MFATKQLFSIVALSAFFTIASAQTRSGCSRTGTAQEGDTCDAISARYGVSTFQLAYVNKDAIDTFCDNVLPGDLLCLGLDGEDCKTVAVIKSGDSCSAIASAANIPVLTLLANNPNINPDCSNIYPGEVLCVASDFS